jgi:hypothetical protein
MSIILNICYYYRICVNTIENSVFINDISSLGVISSVFSSNYCKYCRNITHLGKNVVVLDICQMLKFTTITKLLQILTQLSLLQLCIDSIQLSLYRMPTKLAYYMQ